MDDQEKYKIYVKNLKTGEFKKLLINTDKEEKTNYEPSDKNPKHWSNKFWGENVLSDVLEEAIEPDSIDVDDYYKKDELCPNVWDDNDVMQEDVRKALLEIVKSFIEYSEFESLKFKDIILTGSLANYNWTEQSDLDVHLLMDFKQIADDQELVGEFLKNKKTIWNERLPITVKGHEVEMYVQDINEPHASTGIYSIINNDWNTKPIKEIIQLDVGNIQLKTADIMNAIDELDGNENSIVSVNEINRILERLQKMRKTGLDRSGEFSSENIVFKILRRSGYIEKLIELKNEVITRELTLESLTEYEEPTKLKYANAGNKKIDVRELIRKAKHSGTITIGLLVGILAGSGMSPDELVQYGIDNVTIENTKKFISTTFGEFTDFIGGKPNTPLTHK